MKVTVAVNGRFHAFDLAAQLHKNGCLQSLITTYPKFKVKEWGIPGHKVVSLLPLEILNRTIKYFPLRIQNRLRLKQKELFDFCVSKLIPKNTDIYVGWSSNSLRSLKKAKSIGAIAVLERGSSHMLTQLDILRSEYKKMNIKFREHHRKITEREIDEYEIADYISVPSLFAKTSFLEQGISASKLIVNNYGADLSMFYPSEKSDSVFRVIYVGALSIRKGSYYLLKAIDELNDIDIELWHFGSVSTEMNRILTEIKSNKIILKGSISQLKLYKYYGQCNALLFPSLEDGFGMVILQAMACGLPIVGTTNTGCLDVIQNGVEGFLIPVKDLSAIKDKLRYLYHHPQIAKKIGKSARKKVQSGFTWEDYGNRMIAHYRNMQNSR